MTAELKEEDLVNNRYSTCDSEKFIRDEQSLHNIISGIMHIVNCYGKTIAYIFPIFEKIDKHKDSDDKFALDEVRKGLLGNMSGTVNYIHNLKKNDPEAYRAMTRTVSISCEEIMIAPAKDYAFSYTVSFYHVKDMFDNLFSHVLQMLYHRNVLEWNCYFKDIENDLRNIYDELDGLRYITTSAFMATGGSFTVDYNESEVFDPKRDITVKSISDICQASNFIMGTIERIYRTFISVDFSMLTKFNVSDPSNAAAKDYMLNRLLGRIDDELEMCEDSDGIKTNEEEKDIEDFVDTEV